MKFKLALAATMLAGATSLSATAQQLYGVSFSGGVYRIDRITGAATFIGNSGFSANAADGFNGRIYSMSSNNQIIEIDPATGVGTIFRTLTAGPAAGYGVRGLAITPTGGFFAVLSQSATTAEDLFARIDLTTNTWVIIGGTGQTDVQGLAVNQAGRFVAIGVILPQEIYEIDPVTGAATVVGASNVGDNAQALEFDASGTLWASREALYSISLPSGAGTLIGPHVTTSDIRGLAFIGGGGPTPCECVDFNMDMEVDFSDIEGFLAALAAMTPGRCAPGADFNGDTEFDFSDIESFLAAYVLALSGC